MNMYISKELHTTMSRPFYSDAKKRQKMCRSSSSSLKKYVLGCHLSVNKISSYSSNQGGS